MPVITFEKILKIIEVIVSLLASALKSFNFQDFEDSEER